MSGQEAFPLWVRFASLLWLAVWIPSYAKYWGWINFLHLCDVAVILTCLGFAFGNSPLLSTQAVSSLAADLLWCLDASWRWIFGHHLVGGTEYMWDARFPLWVRLLSLFHVILPVVILAGLRRVGYDRRAWRWQSGIAAALFVLSRFWGPAHNLNYAFTDPVLHRSFSPAPVHLSLMFLGLVIILYCPTHLLLARFFPPPRQF